MERVGLRKYVKQQQPRHDRHTVWSWVYQKTRVPVKSRTRPSDFPFTFHFPALEKEMATHSSVLACRIPGMGEPGGLPFYGVTQSRTRLKWLSRAEREGPRGEKFIHHQATVARPGLFCEPEGCRVCIHMRVGRLKVSLQIFFFPPASH